jgi:hypothetical protein
MSLVCCFQERVFRKGDEDFICNGRLIWELMITGRKLGSFLFLISKSASLVKSFPRNDIGHEGKLASDSG